MEIDRRTFVSGLAATAILPFSAETAGAAAPAYEPIPHWILNHPSSLPEYDGEMGLGYCPESWSSTAKWLRFRDVVLKDWANDEPTNPLYPLWHEHVNQILAYREGLPLEQRFWRKDA